MSTHQTVNQTAVVYKAAADPNQKTEKTALFNEDGTPYTTIYPVVTTGTAIGTAAKTTTSVEPKPNTLVPIKFTNGNNAASPTVAFNGGSARSILLGGTAPGAAEITVGANGVVMFFFDGTALHQFGVTS